MGILRTFGKTFSNVFNEIKKGFKNVTQKYDYDCGPSTVSMLLSLYKINVTEEILIKKLDTNIDGTNWENIEEYLMQLRKFELRQQEYNLKGAHEYLNQGYPLMICWQVDCKPEWSHYSIILSMDTGYAVILNPEDKKIKTKLKMDYFQKCWKKEHFWFAVLIPYVKDDLSKSAVNYYLKEVL